MELPPPLRRGDETRLLEDSQMLHDPLKRVISSSDSSSVSVRPSRSKSRSRRCLRRVGERLEDEIVVGHALENR
jgi:hypothetical protein